MIKSGALGELAAMKHFLGLGHEVYAAVTDSSTYDLILAKDGKTLRVEVKTTSARNKAGTGWVVQVKSVRSNKTRNKIIQFDREKVDVLAVYIAPLDRIFAIASKNITQTTAITILDWEVNSPASIFTAAA